MIRNTIAIIPIKDFTKSKLRLSHIFSDIQRQTFSSLMLQDVLNAIIHVSPIDKIVITTQVKQNLKTNNISKLEILIDPIYDINNALKNAIIYCKQFRLNQILILPGDIPLITPKDIEELLDFKISTNSQIVLVPSNKYDGTNALLFDSNLEIQTHFGLNSYQKHKSEYEKEYNTKIFKSLRIGLDIDTEEDIKTIVNYLSSYKLRSINYLKHLKII
ncbi:MAG: 2-phospho-L-lactate guanylyltransferase [Candidatus Helarchaeota archaeon]